MTDLKTFLQEVIDKADAATPGPWEVDAHEINHSGSGDLVATTSKVSDVGYRDWKANAEYIATLSPDKAKALAQALLDVLALPEPEAESGSLLEQFMLGYIAALENVRNAITSALGKNGEGE